MQGGQEPRQEPAFRVRLAKASLTLDLGGPVSCLRNRISETNRAAATPASRWRRIFDWSKFDPSMVAAGSRPSLVEELTTYRDRLPELLQREGAYVVIKGQDLTILDDRDAALRYVVEHYGSMPVLVMKIVAREPVGSLGARFMTRSHRIQVGQLGPVIQVGLCVGTVQAHAGIGGQPLSRPGLIDTAHRVRRSAARYSKSYSRFSPGLPRSTSNVQAGLRSFSPRMPSGSSSRVTSR